VADVHRLMQVDQLAALAQPVEELTEIFLHPVSPMPDKRGAPGGNDRLSRQRPGGNRPISREATSQ
jgi:hypothetical protein